MVGEPVESDLPLPQEVIQAAVPYSADSKPVFVGHYWLKGQQPELLRPNVACVDWSVAKGGCLCAYRWDGERSLDHGKFVWDGHEEWNSWTSGRRTETRQHGRRQAAALGGRRPQFLRYTSGFGRHGFFGEMTQQ